VLRVWPRQALRSAVSTSSAITAQNGELLRLTLAADGQYRLWVKLEDMPPRLPAAVLMYEDRWFYAHPGVNPVSLARALGHCFTGGRRLGASTISMQLVRRLDRLDTRSALGKLEQITAALWLEARYSKHDILEAYLNLAPYGGNVEGAASASLVFFGKPVAQLSVPQIMALAVIPQNPRARRIAGAVSSDAVDAARRRLWTSWVRTHPGDGRFSGDVEAAVVAREPTSLPFSAPHFTDAILRTAHGDVRTTLDLGEQRSVERLLKNYVSEHSAIGIRNAAALLLEVDSSGAARTRAYVGSADYDAADIDGQVNAITAKRSPGSTLKPFIYALALDQGLLHPRTILKDTPSSFGPFSPENFDGRFVGPIAAEDALIRSRNVPAVAIANRLSHPNLYDFLEASGVSHLKSEGHYGLALALGAGEVSMEELGRMYATLLTGGRAARLQAVDDAPGVAGERLLSEEASFITLDMLDKNPRPDTGQPAAPAVAWKTGTSWGFHDAWSVGVFGRYVLVVWIGNFDNTENPAFIGVQAAAPLLFRIIDGLRSQGLDAAASAAASAAAGAGAGAEARVAPRNLVRVEVCAASGDLPNAECPQTVPTWYIPGKSPIRVSTLHQRVYLDAAGRSVCGPGPGVREEIYEFWSSDMLRLFRDAGMPRRVAPLPCDGSPAKLNSAPPQIVTPLRGVIYTLRVGRLEPLLLHAALAAQARAVYWFADNAYVGRAAVGESVPWLPAHAGRYALRAVDDSGAADARDIDIEVAP
jgi:penicillin-binding protein 1C